ncbi:MAG: hypothetical protein K9W45_07905 [Candidatus Heimdallarchaeum aukensis]|uniref:Uncharacterized protein n=1 Tax=Candidatus Heimdallarchaeum aukensis TaxID=2876573 RepID=A0A9Y1BIM1_9ARCH|nr:MAG: hypothetical protein K9W45_07905 [Candidatus Heimdallarchaeum aukensis]
MSKTLLLSIYKNFLREKITVLILVILPLILILTATATVPDQTTIVILEGKIIDPQPNAKALAVVVNALTAVAMVTSITAFFANIQLRKVKPRLEIMGYSSRQISTTFILFATGISILTSVAIYSLSLIWFTPYNSLGFFSTLIIGSLLFSTTGLVLSTLIKSRELGLYLLLTIVILDVAFLEHPFYSRQYDNSALIVMPGHYVIRMVFRAAFKTGKIWIQYLPHVILYELFLFLLLILVTKLTSKKG